MQGSSPKPPQLFHGSPSSHAHESRHLRPLPPSGTEDDGETQDKVCQSQVSESALCEYELDGVSGSECNRASTPVGPPPGD